MCFGAGKIHWFEYIDVFICFFQYLTISSGNHVRKKKIKEQVIYQDYKEIDWGNKSTSFFKGLECTTHPL